MVRCIAIVIVSIALAACAPRAQRKERFALVDTRGSDALRAAPGARPDTMFPPRSFGSDDVFERSWYGNQLQAMAEPRLSPSQPHGDTLTVIRFTWLRTFHPGIAVRVQQHGEQSFVVLKRLDGAGGYAPGALIRVDSFAVSRATAGQLIAPLEEPSFWVPPQEVVGLDGSEWIFELRSGSLYRVSATWSPETTGRGADKYAAGLALLRAARVVEAMFY